jgi:hypothetical protein
VDVHDPPARLLAPQHGAQAHLDLRAVGEEPRRLVGVEAHVAIGVRDRVRAGDEALARDLRAAPERVLVVDPLARRPDEDEARVA